MEEKTCITCGIKKLLTSEYFYRNKRSKSGFSYYCKECEAKTQFKYVDKKKEYAKRNKEYLKTN